MSEDSAKNAPLTLATKKKMVDIKHVPLSKDQPYQIYLKRNGVFLKGCKTMLEVDAHLHTLPANTFIRKVTRREARTTR